MTNFKIAICAAPDATNINAEKRAHFCFEAEDDFTELDTLLRALICTLEHEDFVVERETMNRLMYMMQRKLRSLKETLGLSDID